jgi:hypothetical protein
MTDLASLIERAKKATDSDPSLEADIVEHFFGATEADLHRRYLIDMHRFTSSLDAALALAERVLPDCDWAVTGGKGLACEATIWPQTDRNREVGGKASSPPLAILLATLKAKAAE